MCGNVGLINSQRTARRSWKLQVWLLNGQRHVTHGDHETQSALSTPSNTTSTEEGIPQLISENISEHTVEHIKHADYTALSQHKRFSRIRTAEAAALWLVLVSFGNAWMHPAIHS